MSGSKFGANPKITQQAKCDIAMHPICANARQND
jgi:hypothetical protein